MKPLNLRQRHMKDSFGKERSARTLSTRSRWPDIVTTMTRDPEVICAAVLHDTIEDCAGVTKETLEDRFGERVAMLVDCESEDKSKSWEERKSTTIRRLRTAPREVQMIGLADKLSNMRDIHRGLSGVRRKSLDAVSDAEQSGDGMVL